MVAAEGQPRRHAAETEIGCVAHPRHRRTRTVARQRHRPIGDRLGIEQVLERDVDLRQPELLALIQEDVAAETSEQQQLHPRERARMIGARPARHRARCVVILERPARPADRRIVGPARERVRDKLWRQRVGVEEVEAVCAVEPLAARGEQLHLAVAILAADLGDGEASAIFVEQRADPLEERRNVGMALIVELELEIERPGPRAVGRGRGRVIGQRGIVHCEVDRIEPEAVDAAIEPEARGVEQFLLHRRIVPVELRLFLEEIVEIILLPPRVPRPRRAAEHRLPVRRRAAVGLGVGPDVPVGLVARPARAARLEPRMLVRRVRIDLVDDDAQSERVRARDQRVEIGERPEDRVDVAIVRHVIAEILHRRGEEGRQPDGVHPEPGDVFEMRGDAVEVADPVTVRVGKAARVDLIDRCALPPGFGSSGNGVLGRGGHRAHSLGRRAGVAAQMA